jgi:two-component system chemotaxis sensor kinase CheA
MAQDPYKYFRIEARELVGELAKGLLELEKRADTELVARILRHAHTLKGAARIVKHRELADLAHAMEGLIEPLRAAPRTQRHDAALALVDRMTEQLATLDPAPTSATVRTDDHPPILRADTAAVDDVLAALGGIQSAVVRAQATGEAALRNQLLDQVERSLREVQKDVEHLRLTRAGAMFTQLERAARDAAVAGGKRVAFVTEGAEIRIDADVLGVLQGALVQLVRNAVVHGIETPAARTTAGKPQDGRIAVTVVPRGRRVAITCEDDGRGLDLDAIRKAAANRGVATGSATDPVQVFELLLRGGITTSKQVDELAGRGIGLDVVRDAAQRLGGEIEVTTSRGRGTAITVIVPVSMAAVAILTVSAGDRWVAIPQAAVRRVGRVPEGAIVASGSGMSLAFDDAIVPCAPIAQLVGAPRSPARTAVYVEAAGGVAAVLVERVIGLSETIVRAVPAGTPVEPIVWGMALDPSGQPYPVLDATALVAATRAARYEPDAPVEAPRPILIVDDSLTTRMLERSILESAGFAVEMAVSAEEALDKLARSRYALMLVDVEMPGMDGFALISAIRSRPALAELPAILVTSRDAPGDRRRGHEVGAQGYVVKSQFDQAALVAMIRRLVQS